VRTPILEIFEEDMYEILDVKGKIVVDVGAYIGDSAIYFALKGAKRAIMHCVRE
jgi:predicted O-methyltransferase YrrM